VTKRRASVRRLLRAHRRQDGVVLFVALIVMVVMTLGAIALIRSMDTTNLAVGNLAFRQSSILPANIAVETAAAALFPDANRGGPMVADLKADDASQNYFATYRYNAAGWDNKSGVPRPLQTKAAARALSVQLTDDAGNEITYVVERMCADGKGAGAANLTWCDMMPPKQAPGTTVNDPELIQLPPTPFYRVTVRVDGPKNTTSFVQAMLR
jgi:hypothetical protein